MIMLASPLIAMNGEAAEAIAFYEQALEAKVVFKQTFGEIPEPKEPISEEIQKRINHSVLKLGDAEMYVSDKLPGETHSVGNQVTVCLTVDTTEHAQRLFDALKQGGEVHQPLQPIFFSPAYGIVTDKFGVTFYVFTKRPA
ncbi:VOC family protein [Paenibacillus sp. DXFW5]|uniref:VOC family protein n=1 Tax=Paenibacillus rhizolycopersici TaxID=2780073 RepID=A0ABS2H097_9BACL|nr:VOC family protein [Paenibacillus rhizolycopersici]MBM6994672.1 VOC family protein [Paenibacillus rhizolycopersici]